ncbi:MAG: RNA methyltransferase [Candidatus Neomarinimicrobiota bacterium]|nr:RNA methyltransferase [Candidatus Neomarinimicrobiota bacterium]|tara:strand:- start:464 stop:1024 length:561 start_codon:yes stop_codon:yes gene_type:complete
MTNRIKRCNDELKADRPTIEEVKFIPRLPISILVENVRSVHNVGSIFRSADGFGAEKIYLTGYTAYPPRQDLHKTALGAEDAVPWDYDEDPIKTARLIKKAGYSLVLVEQTHDSVSIYDMDFKFPICFIVGNEVDGVSEALSREADFHVELPMRGIKQSLNVSVATGVVGYEFARHYMANELVEKK